VRDLVSKLSEIIMIYTHIYIEFDSLAYFAGGQENLIRLIDFGLSIPLECAEQLSTGITTTRLLDYYS
jgi:hypothetical protein